MLIKIVEFFIILFLLQAAIRLILPQRQQYNKQSAQKKKPLSKRFEAKGKDIADGEFEELR